MKKRKNKVKIEENYNKKVWGKQIENVKEKRKRKTENKRISKSIPYLFHIFFCIMISDIKRKFLYYLFNIMVTILRRRTLTH